MRLLQVRFLVRGKGLDSDVEMALIAERAAYQDVVLLDVREQAFRGWYRYIYLCPFIARILTRTVFCLRSNTITFRLATNCAGAFPYCALYHKGRR